MNYVCVPYKMDTITIETDSCVFLGAGDKSIACVSFEPSPHRGKGDLVNKVQHFCASEFRQLKLID